MAETAIGVVSTIFVGLGGLLVLTVVVGVAAGLCQMKMRDMTLLIVLLMAIITAIYALGSMV